MTRYNVVQIKGTYIFGTNHSHFRPLFWLQDISRERKALSIDLCSGLCLQEVILTREIPQVVGEPFFHSRSA